MAFRLVKGVKAESKALLIEIRGMVATLVDTAKDHEQRIRWTERTIWMALGAGMASGGVIGALTANIINK